MKPQAISILEFISSTNRTFVIPVYQRNYSWEPKNCEKLFNDLVQSLRDGKHHYFGNIVYYALNTNFSSGYTELALIDGQQRVTSVMLLLAAIRDSEKDQEKKDGINNIYLKNERGDELNRIKLKQIESDRSVYEAIIDGNFDGSTTSNAGKNYKKFLQLIKESGLPTDDLLKAINNLEVVALDLNLDRESESPQIIFESINATGKELTTADLLRNYLLLGIKDAAEQEDYYKNYWLPIEKNIGSSDDISDFINKYLIMRIGDTVNKGAEYEEFKRQYSKLFNGDAKAALEDLKYYSKYFLWIKDPACIYKEHKKTSEAFADLQEINITTITPLLLWISERADNSDCSFDMDGLTRALRYIESWAFRVRVTNLLTSGQFNTITSRLLLNTIKRASTDNYDELIRYELSNYRTQDIWPTDSEFRSAFTKYNFYKTYKNYVQRKLEYKISNDRINEKPDSIEHILPETLNQHWKEVLGPDYSAIHAEWLHTIGNLTPMNQPDNSFNSNDSYEKKLPQYKKSSWELTRKVAEDYSSWDATAIENRGQNLARIATDIWQGPIPRERPITADVRKTSGRVALNDEIRGKIYKIDYMRQGAHINAKMSIENTNGVDRFIVLAGSEIFPYSSFGQQPKAFKALQKQGFNFEQVLTKDFKFDTPSGASNFVTGTSQNGWDYWQDEDGQSLNDLASDLDNEDTGEADEVFNNSLAILSEKSLPQVKDVYDELDKFMMSLGEDVSKHATKTGITYTNGKSFADINFRINYLVIYIMSGAYDDPEERVVKLDDSYNFTNDRRLEVRDNYDLEYAKNIIKQSYEKTK